MITIAQTLAEELGQKQAYVENVIALLDERFLQGSYRMFFPREWEDFEVVNHNNISKKIERFWDSWL